MERSLAQLHFPHAASLQIRATVVMLNPISRAIVGSDLPAALSSFTLPRSVITFGFVSADQPQSRTNALGRACARPTDRTIQSSHQVGLAIFISHGRQHGSPE